MIAEPMVARLRLAADYLHEHGWTRGTERDNAGRVGLTGAIRYCAPQNGDEYLIREVLRKRGRAEDWNDVHASSAEEVENYLRTTEVTDEDLAQTFGPQWEQIVELVRTMFTLTSAQWERLDASWDANRDTSWAASQTVSQTAGRVAGRNVARDAGRAVGWDAGMGAVMALNIRDLIGQYGFTQEHYDTLTGPWRRVVGGLHPDDADLSDDLPEAARRMNGQIWVNPGEAFVGTCDAGNCDDDTFAIVLTDNGWLSLCREHTMFEIAQSVKRDTAPEPGA